MPETFLKLQFRVFRTIWMFSEFAGNRIFQSSKNLFYNMLIYKTFSEFNPEKTPPGDFPVK